MSTDYLTRIIGSYRLLREQDPDKCIEFTLAQTNLHDALTVAAKAIDARNKVHSHQRRNGKVVLAAFANRHQQYEDQLAEAHNFDEIISTVALAIGPRIGDTAIYDTAHRISLYLRKPPDKIYLHAGTRTGARKLIGRLGNRKFLLLSDMPPEFQRPDLSAADLEDILCIFKKKFRLYEPPVDE